MTTKHIEGLAEHTLSAFEDGSSPFNVFANVPIDRIIEGLK